MSVSDGLTGAADPARVRDEMIALKDPERRKRAKAAEQAFQKFPWRGNRDRASQEWRAAALAWVGTATARTIVSRFWWIAFELQKDPQLADDVYAVLAARGRAFFATLARGLLRGEGAWGSWPLVRRGVREGLIDPPDGDEYVRGLVFGVSPGARMEELEAAYEGLLADPQLLEDEVWRLFEVDAGADLSNANTWEPKEAGKPAEGYTRGDNRWLHALTRLAGEGRLDRQRLLDASLDALMRDFRASTVGWYAKLHEELEPTRTERIERLDRYLALVTSPAPVVAKEGLAALGAIEEDVPPLDFARVAATPFTQRQKNLALETLALLARLCKRHPDDRPVLLDAVAEALAHERGDVQERAVKLLEQYPDAAPRATLLGYVDAASPTLRPRVEALTGVAATEQPRVVVGDLPEPRVPRPAPGEPIEPIRDVDELIELAAALLAGHGDGDDAERFLDGVSRLCDQRPPGFKQRTQGLMAQAGEHESWRPQLSSGNDLVATVVRAWARGKRPKVRSPDRTLGGILAHRALEVAARAARRRPRRLVAFPTHAGGWVDPVVVEARAQSGRGFLRRQSVDHYDQLGARLRAVGDAELRLQPVVHKTGADARVEVEHGPLPDALSDVDEVAESVRRIGRSVQWWEGDSDWLADDPLGARWLLTVVPAVPEVQYARAFVAVVDRIDASVYRNPEVVLEHALGPSVPLRDPGWDLAAAALLAKAPDLGRLAVDVLAATVDDRRFDARKLGLGLARLLDQRVGTPTRLAQPLRDASRVSPLHGVQVVRAVESMLSHLRTEPRGLHAPLEVAVEAAAATGRRIEDPDARAALGRLEGSASRSSKLGKLARSLLAA